MEGGGPLFLLLFLRDAEKSSRLVGVLGGNQQRGSLNPRRHAVANEHFACRLCFFDALVLSDEVHPLMMPFFGAGWSGAVDMAIMLDEIEWLDLNILWISAMDRLAPIADDHVLYEPPHDVVEDRHAEE